MAQKKPFEFPQSLLKQVDECSRGGFILFSLGEDGEPEIYSHFDNSTQEMGLLFFATAFCQAKLQENGNIIDESVNGEWDEGDED